MSASPPHFLLVDDHALFRTGLGLMLSQHWPAARVVQAASWGEALRYLQGELPDLILLDVHLPDGHGLADLPVLRTLAPHCPVLLMSAEVTAGQVQGAREAGVLGLLPKAIRAGEVLSAVQAALAGQSAFAAVPYDTLLASKPGHTALRDAGGLQANEAAPGLSVRQIEILRYLGRSTPNKAIARHLGMSENDVRAEVSWLTEWLGASSREQAHAEAMARGLVS